MSLPNFDWCLFGREVSQNFYVSLNLAEIRNLKECTEYKYRISLIKLCVWFFLNGSINLIDCIILENLTSWYKWTPSPHSTGIHHWWLALVKMETHQLLVIWPCPDSSFCITSMFSIPGRFLFPSLGNWYRLHCLFQPCDSDIRWR